MSKVTLNNIDFLDSRSVEIATGILWAAHRQAKINVELFSLSEEEVRDQFSAHRNIDVSLQDTLIDEDGEESRFIIPAKIHPKGFYRGDPEQVIQVVRSHVERDGHALVTSVAKELGVTADTVRSLVNSGSHSFKTRWNVSSDCEEYYLEDALA